MSIYENLKTFFGKPVVDFRASGDIDTFASAAPRLRCEYDDKLTIRDLLATLLEEPGVGATEALVLGMWAENGEAFEVAPDTALEMLVSSKQQLPELKALFIGDIISEENEISWIQQGDQSAIWGAFPKLEHFTVRGGNGLRLGQINHSRLSHLTVQTGGLSSVVVNEALSANAPLTHLELWLGDANYGANATVEDFAPLLAGELFPQLTTLALCNAEFSDDLAAALADSALLERIKVLDLSMGTLTDRGALALAESGRISHLERLNISHHYVGSAALAKLKLAAPQLEAADQQEPDDWDGELHYYVAVSE